jgi:hypothetical protein
VLLVPLFREITLDPLHNLGQRDAGAGFYEKMDMAVHYGEVPEFKIELRFGGFDEIEEGLLDLRAPQGHRVVVDFGINLVRDFV